MGILGESRGSWSLPSCSFQLGFHLVLEETGLPPCSPWLLREGMPQLLPAHCMWDTNTKRWLLPEPGPRRWMLCSSALPPARSERCEALWESSDSKTASVEEREGQGPRGCSLQEPKVTSTRPQILPLGCREQLSSPRAGPGWAGSRGSARLPRRQGKQHRAGLGLAPLVISD